MTPLSPQRAGEASVHAMSHGSGAPIFFKAHFVEMRNL
jgi:hypothetical protein